MNRDQLTGLIFDALRSAPGGLRPGELAEHITDEVIQRQRGAVGGDGQPGVACGRGICALGDGHDGICRA